MDDPTDQIVKWLRATEVSGIAELYLAAVRIVEDKKFPARALLIAHLGREIVNRLPDIAPQTKVRKFTDQERLSPVIKAWTPHAESIRIAAGASGPLDEEPMFNMPISVLKLTVDVFDAFGERMTFGDKVGSLVLHLAASNEGFFPSHQAWVRQYVSVQKRFVGHAHLRSGPETDDQTRIIEEAFMQLTDILGAIVRPFLQTLGSLDEILQDANN